MRATGMSRVAYFPRLVLVLSLLIVTGLAGPASAQTCTPPTIVQVGGSNPSCSGRPVTLDAGAGWATYQWSNGATTRIMTDSPTANTSYTVTVTDGSGCSVTSAALQLVVTANPVAPDISLREPALCGTTQEGEASTSYQGFVEWGISGGTFLTGTGGASVRYTATGSGPVQLSLTALENGCSETSYATVNVNPTPTVSIVTSATAACRYVTHSASVNAPGSWSSLTWTITNGTFFDGTGNPLGSTTNTETVYFATDGSTPGPLVLTVIGTDSNGCQAAQATKELAISRNEPPVISTSVTSICSYTRATATAAPPAQGTWQTVGWRIENGYFLDEFNNQTPYATGESVTFYSGATGPVVLYASGHDSFGCYTSSESMKQIPLRTIENAVISTNRSSICPYDSGTATVAPPAEGSWSTVGWSIENGYFLSAFNTQTSYANGEMVTFYSNGSGPVRLYASAYDSFGCMTPTPALKEVPLRTIENAVISTSVSSICRYTSATATVAPPAEGTWQSVGWSIENGHFYDQFWNQTSYANGETVTFYSNGNGPVRLFASGYDSFGCLTPTPALKEVPLRTVEDVVISTSVSSICRYTSATATAAPPAEGTWSGVSWSIENGYFYDQFWNQTTYTNGETVTFYSNGNGPVRLFASGHDSFGCMTSTPSLKVVPLRTIENVVISTSVSSICPYNSATATAAPPAEGTWSGVSWYIENGYFYDQFWNQTTYASGETVTFYSNGNGPVRLMASGYDSFGCMTPTPSEKVVALRTIAPVVISTSVSAMCGTGSAQASAAPPAEGGSWAGVSWSIENGYFYDPYYGQTTYASGETVTFYANGNGDVRLYASGYDALMCQTPQPALKTVPLRQPPTPVITTVAAICPYTWETTVATIEPPAEGTWQSTSWSIENGYFVDPYGGNSSSAEGDTVNFSAWGGNAVILRVTAVDSFGCMSTYTERVVPFVPQPTITPSGPTTFCEGGSVTLTASEADSYSWYNGATTRSITVTEPGYYGLSTMTNGCYQYAPSVEVTVTTIQQPTITAGGPTAFCPGGSVTLTASEGASYAWSTGATTREITVSEGGDYTVTVTNAAGCASTSNPTTVTVLSTNVTITAPASLCPNVSGNTASVPDAGAGATYTWSINNGTWPGGIAPTGRTATFTAGSGGIVTLSVTVTGSSCTSSGSVSLSIVQPPFAQIIPPAYWCAGTTAVVRTPDAGPGVTYFWNVQYGTIVSGQGTTEVTILSESQSAPAFERVELTVTGPTGCARTIDDRIYMDRPASTITASGPLSFCQGGSVTLTAPSGMSAYAWSTGATTQSITVTTGGTYYVTVTNANGCSRTSLGKTVVVNANPAVPTITTSGSTTFCEGESVTLYAPAGYTYLWSTGATADRITVTQSGNYSVTVTTAAGCSSTSTPTAVTVNPAPPATITPSGIVYYCSYDSARLTANAGGESYLWSNGATTRSIEVSQDGTYTVTVTYPGGCSKTSGTVWVYGNGQQPNVWIDTQYTVCPNSTNTATVNDPSIVATYEWEIENGTIVGPADGSSISYVAGAAGTTVNLTCWVKTTAGGCYRKLQRTVESRLPVANVQMPTSMCEGMSGYVIRASEEADWGATYAWTISGPGELLNEPSYQGWHRLLKVNGPGEITIGVTVTYPGGCQVSDSKSGTAVAVPAGGITTPSMTCSRTGNTATAASTSDSYSWGITGGTIVGATNGASVTYTVTGATATLSLYQANGSSCLKNSSKTVTFDGATPLISSNAGNPACPGQAVTLTAPANMTAYAWSNGATTRSITVTEAGSYSVTTTTANGCTATSAPFNLTYRTIAPPVVVFNHAQPMCETQQEFTTTVTNASDFIFVHWQISNVTGGVAIVGTNGGTASWFRNPGSTGTITAVGTTANGCEVQASVQIVNRPGPDATILGSTSTCSTSGTKNNSVADAGPGATYAWTVSGGTIVQGANARSVWWNPWAGRTSVNLYVEVTDASGCKKWDVQDVTITQAPNVQINVAPAVCPGGTQTASIAPVPGASHYAWSVLGGQPVSGVTSTELTFQPAGAGGSTRLQVVVYMPGGCNGEDTEYVYSYDVQYPTVTASGPIEFCEGGSVTLTAQESPSYLWSNGQTTRSITVTESGDYYFSTTGQGGCPVSSGVTQVRVSPFLDNTNVNVSGPTTFCPGGSVTLTAASEYGTYLWSNGATTRAITVTQSGSYTLTVTSNNSCSQTSAPVVVTVHDSPATPTITAGGSTTFCDGGSVTLTASSGASYSWSTGATTQSITVDAGGSYTVTVTDANGCSATSAPTTVTENVATTPTITAGGATTFCAGGSVTLTASNGASYSWSTGATTQSITVDASGSYSVTVTDANGCSATSASTVVTENVATTPTITAGGATTFCEGGSVTLTASNGASYSWSNGATTQSITVDASGSYSVTVTDANGCSATSAATTVTENVATTPTITAGGATTFCAGGSVTLTASNGASYSWSTGATTQSITVDASGSYSVTVTDANGCSATSAATTVTENIPSTPTITAGGSTSFCEGGSVTLTASNGASYSWSTGATTQSITVDASGTFTVTVTDANGCSATSAPTVVTENVAATPIITPSGSTTFCTGGSVTLTASNGASWSWSNGATTQSITVTAAGSYSVTVVDANGCTASSAATIVTVNSIAATDIHVGQRYDDEELGYYGTIVSDDGTNVLACGNPRLQLIATLLGPSYTYSWSTGAASPNIFVTTSGTYTLTVTNAAGCSTSSTVNVTINPTPATPAITASATQLCPAGGSVTLTAPAGFDYLWSNGATTQSITVTQPGSYQVRVIAGGCPSQLSNAIVITNGVSSITAGGSTDICPNGSVTLTANAGDSYVWSNGATTQSIVVTQPGQYSVTVTANGCTYDTSAAVTVTQRTLEITPQGPTTFCDGGQVYLSATPGAATYLWSNGMGGSSVPVTASGSYTVTATWADGCSITSAPIVVEERAVEATIASDRTAVCAGTPIEFTSTVSGSPGVTYQWILGPTTPIAGATSPTLTYTPTSGGYVYLRVTDTALGCEDTSNAIVFTVHDTPDATITAPSSVCAGSWSTATVADAGAGATYNWSITGGTISFNGNAEVSFQPSGSGPITLSVTITNPGCSVTDSATIAINPLPSAAISGTLSFCTGGSTTLTASGGASYSWNTGATGATLNVSAPGTYTVTVTNANGCQSTASATVTENALPSAAISGTLSFCTDGSTTLTASGGTSYSWNTGATGATLNVTQPGTYTVTVTNANGCQSTASATVTENALPTASISGTLSFCTGGSTTLTASGGTSYSWNTGATGATLNVTQAGTYTVTVTNANGCQSTASATVTENALPAASISGTLSFCTGGSTTLTASGGTSYSWNTGATGATLNVNAPGTYTVTVTNANGCQSTASATVTENALPAASISGTLSFCTGGSTTLAASGGTAYSWNTGATGATLNVNAPGTYTVTVTNANGCQSTASATVTENALPTAAISGTLSFCTGGSTTLTASGGTSYSWNTGATGATLNVSAPGTYTVTVTNANGCQSTASATVTENALPTASISGTLSFCTGGSTTLTASGGTSYSWNTGATGATLNVTAAGVYTVTVTNANGCQKSTSVTVTENALPTAAISGTLSFCAGGSTTLTASGGTSYSWNTGATGATLNVTAAGVYTVTVTNANGCQKNASVTVTENALPNVPTISGATTFCANAQTILTSTAGSSYLWSNGATTQSITVTTPGAYHVTVYNAAGCGRQSATVNVTTTPATAINSQPYSGPSPRNASVTLTVGATGTGSLSYTWQRGTSATGPWTTVQSGASASYTTPKLGRGTYWYRVTVTSSCGTVTSNVSTITVN